MNFKDRFRAAHAFFKDLARLPETKSAYDKLPVGVVGRPQYPSVSVYNLQRFHRTNELVFACIRAIAYAAMDPEPIVERRTDKGEWSAHDGHPLRRLLMWPNPLMNGAEFAQAILTSAQIAGVFYAEIVRDGLDLPDQLWPLDPSKVFPVPGSDGQGGTIAGYEFRDGTNKEFIPARDMLTYRLLNPGSRFEGLSPLMVALGSVDADTAMTDYVRAFFDTGGVPNGVLKIKRTLNDDQIRAIQQKWLLKYGKRGIMKGAPAVLDDQSDYQKTGANLDELESEVTRGQHEARICGAFGVPPILVGAYIALKFVNQRASVKEAQQDFWQNTMSPMMTQLRLFFTTRLLPEFEQVVLIHSERVRVGWKLDHVAGMQEDQDGAHKRARDNFQGGGLSFNEFRAKIGEKPAPDGDFFLLPRGFKPITPQQALAQATAPAVTDTTVPGSGGGGTGDPSADNQNGGQPGDNQNPKSASGGPSERKFLFEGLDLRREPTELEKKAGLPEIVKTLDGSQAKLEKVLLSFREEMITTAISDLSSLEPGMFHTLALTIGAAQIKKVRALVGTTFDRGRASVTQELQNQGKANTFQLETKADSSAPHSERLDSLSETTLTKLANDVQARVIGRASELVLLGYEWETASTSKAKKPKSLDEQLLEDLSDGSTRYATQAASGATNAAFSLGRSAEAEARADDIKEVVYSAVLDSNTCGPCEDADGETGATENDVSTAPNPACEGGTQCRCILIHVLA